MAKKITFFSILLLFFFQFSQAFVRIEKDSVYEKSSELLKTKKFKDLNSILHTKTLKYQPLVGEFDASYIARNFSLDSVTNEDLDKAKEAMLNLDDSQNYVDLMSPDDMVTLPVGVKKEIGNITYILGITSAKFTPQYTEVTAFVKIILPQLDAQGKQKQLFFGADNIKLSHKGGIYGEANLVLLGDAPIPVSGGKSLVVLKGGFDMKTGISENLTYVTVDCSGFKELGITADVEFSRNTLEPVDATYKVLPDVSKKVTGSFNTIVSDWNDILVEISLPPFQLTKEGSTDGSGKAGLIFELNTAVFDFSDLRNSDNVVFPDEYQEYLISGNEVLWRGVYVKSLSVILPKQFQKRDSEERITFEASNLLIDGLGVSGTFSVDNILPIDKGSASKWQFSVDHIEATIVTNNLTGAGFEGKIVLPITEELTAAEIKSDSTALKRKALSYTAIIDPVQDEYTLTVAPQDSLSFNVFKAKATLTSDSYVKLKVSEGKFRPKAVLHGNLAIKGSNSETNPEKATVDFKGVEFQNLQLQTESPYFSVDYMGYKGDVKLGGFPVTISDIGVTTNDAEASLKFGIDINMMSEGFSGGTDINIIGKFGEEGGLQSWKYDHLEISRISIIADLGEIQIEGMVDLKDDDPVYGDGFYGELGATFNDISVDASAWFGKTDFRYWYVDAYADLSGLDVKPKIGVLEVNGFGGGAYYRMNKKSNPPMEIYNGEQVKTPKPPSGMDYIPDANAGLGFRALLGFALTNDKALNGKVGFEMAFNTSGGLNRILFFGEAHMVKALDFEFGDKFKEKLTKLENKINDFGENNSAMQSLKEANLVDYSKVAFPQDGLTFDAGIDANFSMEMDFENKVFHSEMEIFVNTPGGLYQGIGPNGRAGWAVFHTGPDGWYLKAGTPEDRLGTKLGIGGLAVESNSYLMMGDQIPGSPAPPAIVAEILGVQDLNTLDSMRELNVLGEGRGFAMGMEFSLDTGDLNFLMFYASFQAGMGFDIMIKDYGETACSGSGQIGLDGWYANGQAYAYLQGELGINVKLLFIKKKIPIITAGAAVLLQAKLPNPAWFRGYVGGHYNLLGGLVKGDFRFKVELGEECEIIGGAPLGGIKIISDITPGNDSGDVDVFTVPQVAFNMSVNKAFQLEDDEGVKTYRILLDEMNFLHEGNIILGTLEWNDNKDVVNFVSSDVLPQNASINAIVKVSFQEKKRGVWETLMNEGQTAQEIEEITFTTGEAPDYIPLTNIEYCYPVVDQNNFYQDETDTGYIKLKQGQPYLFGPNTDWSQKVKYISDADTQIGQAVSYNESEKKVSFLIPTLLNEKEYTLSMISFPPDQDPTEGNQELQYVSQETGYEGNTVEILNQQAQNVVQDDVVVEIITYNLKTSVYNTFAEKINSKVVSQYYRFPISTSTHYLVVDTYESEPFSLLEIVGGNLTKNKPMVTGEALLSDSYYNSDIKPKIYDYLGDEFSLDRNTSILGAPPKRALTLFTWYQTNLENDIDDFSLKTRLPFRYNLSKYYSLDFYDLRAKIVNEYVLDPNDHSEKVEYYSNIIKSSFPSIKKADDYEVKMQYNLPGGSKGTSINYKYVCPN